MIESLANSFSVLCVLVGDSIEGRGVQQGRCPPPSRALPLILSNSLARVEAQEQQVQSLSSSYGSED